METSSHFPILSKVPALERCGKKKGCDEKSGRDSMMSNVNIL